MVFKWKFWSIYLFFQIYSVPLQSNVHWLPFNENIQVSMAKWAEAGKWKLKMSADNENFNKNLVWSFIRFNSTQLQVIFVFVRSWKCRDVSQKTYQAVVYSKINGWLDSRLGPIPSDFRKAYCVSRGQRPWHLTLDFWNPNPSNLKRALSQNEILVSSEKFHHPNQSEFIEQ